MPESLTLDELTITAGDRTLLRDASLRFPAGKITVLVGGSGAGKSVLLRVLAGLLPRDGESISWTGRLHGDGGEPGHTNAAPRIGIVFQQFALFDELSPVGNVQFAIDHRGGVDEPVQSATDWLSSLGVPPGAKVSVLSGGQKQRLAIARTLASNPEILLYDEPTSGLDAATGRRVAELIRHTQSQFGRTSIVVTHDYETLLPIADEVLLLDSRHQTIRRIEPERWSAIATEMESVQLQPETSASVLTEPVAKNPLADIPPWAVATGDAFLRRSGESLVKMVRLPVDLASPVPSLKWAGRFGLHYLRLVGGPSAWLYLAIAGTIVGFTTTYFTLRFLPFRLYTQPLLIDDLLASIGFALYRILVPILATILVAARCGAAVAADVGVKQYGGQVDALKTLGVRPPAYLLGPIVVAFLIATPMLEWLAFTAAHWVSRLTFAVSHVDIGVPFWRQHFFRAIAPDSSVAASLGWFAPFDGFGYVIIKNLVCGFGTAAISYHQGMLPKSSASDVSDCITATVLWSTLYVLVVHFVIALIEF